MIARAQSKSGPYAAIHTYFRSAAAGGDDEIESPHPGHVNGLKYFTGCNRFPTDMRRPTDHKARRMGEFDRVCKERGLPITVQRRAVFEAMLDREDHPAADDIYDAVRLAMPNLSRTSVYRTLETLVETGMVQKVCHPGSTARFDPKISRHHHLVCMKCEKIFDIESAKLDAVPWPNVRAQGFEIADYHIHFRGVCADCRRQGGKKTRPVARPDRLRPGKSTSQRRGV